MARFALLTLLIIFPIALRATVIVPIDFRELVTTTPVIVHGRVTDVRSAFVDGRRSVETFVTIAADEYLKGDLGEHVTFRVPGGEIGRYRTVFVGAPGFSRGDEVVLFLRTQRAALPFIVGLNQGAYRVVADRQSGRRMVTAPIVMGNGGLGVERVVRGDQMRRPLPIESFRDVVRDVLAQGAAR
jgi:hypothetical protein